MPRHNNRPPPEHMPWYRLLWAEKARANPRTDFGDRSLQPPGGDERAEEVIDILINAGCWPEQRKATK